MRLSIQSVLPKDEADSKSLVVTIEAVSVAIVPMALDDANITLSLDAVRPNLEYDNGAAKVEKPDVPESLIVPDAIVTSLPFSTPITSTLTNPRSEAAPAPGE